MAPSDTGTTLLDVFTDIASSSHADCDAVECGAERWTYAELDAISTGIALEIHKSHGLKPVVAVISENNPYILATILATWKLGGVVAPMDTNVPRDIMERMLFNIGPTFVLLPSAQLNVQNVVKENSLPYITFEPKDTTITALMQRYIDQTGPLGHEFPMPSPEDIALYLHTSSASSVDNVKCAPIAHQSILAGSKGRLAWWKSTWPKRDYTHLRVLGWSPWSHIIGLSHDLGAAMLLTRGTYVFAMIPSAYGDAGKASRYLDVCGQLLATAMEKKPTAFAGVPWVLEGFMQAFKQESDAERRLRIQDTIQHFKVFGSGGASTSPECIEFANTLGIPLVFDIGMTEVGGPLFHSTNDGSVGWSAKDCFLNDATLSIVNEDGSLSTTEGELVIKSRYLAKGYRSYESSSFIVEGDSVTFHTGDIYSYVADNRLVWRGRKEDYIQMSSGESLDPRVTEAILNQCPSITRSCVVGNNFLRTSSQVVCAIVELSNDGSSAEAKIPAVIRAVATANRSLAPPLRISWSRVLVLPVGQQIPVTKKGAIFRKKLEDQFGAQLNELMTHGQGPASTTGPTPNGNTTPIADSKPTTVKTKDQIASIVSDIVVDALKVSAETLESNPEATFAELGMDSSMSTKIVNQLNRQLDMQLPLNTCHTHIDLIALTNAILAELGVGHSTDPRPSMRVPPSAQDLEEIVVVGQSIRLPGDINNPSSFWQSLLEQRDDIMTPVPPSRWDHSSFYRSPDSKSPAAPCDITLDKAGWIDLSSFDHSFFGLGFSEAFFVSPTIRLSLELAFEALENANIPISKIKGSDMGVFVANAMDDGYIQLLFADKGWGAYSRFWATGTAASTACGRLSYLLDIHGPSITIDTACSSGLIAVHEAVQYLRSGDGESAIVCGANVHCWPGTLGFLAAQKMTSPNGRCATFTNEADGYVPSEGAAGLVLKTKKAALRDGDRILGVVRATVTKHDGRSQGLVAPNVKAQIAMQVELLEKAGLSPSEIDFVEAHGTGTSLGDLIEIQGINDVFKSSHKPNAPLVVGASKSCIGHTELIAGLIGVLKTLGTFTDGTVPGLVQLTKDNMNPSLDCSVVPLHIPHENVVLKQDKNKPLRALVLSNGFAGSIAGAIFESPSEGMQPKPASRIPENTPMLFVVSAKSPDALTDYLHKYLDFCLGESPSRFHAICYTSCVGREHYRYRFACVAHNMQDLIARLEDRIQNPPRDVAGNARRILFGFPGQGCQYQGMGRYLANQYSGFRKILTEAATEASALTGYLVLPYLVEDSAPGLLSIDNSEVAQVCIYTFQYAMATWLGTLGIEAHAVMGHSLGEITAAVISKAFSFETGLQFVVTRARVLRSDPAHPGGMAAIAATEAVVTRYISEMGLQDQVSIAVYNATDNNVISGDMKAIEKLMAAVKRDGMRATKLAVGQGFHSHSISPGLPALKQWMEDHQSSMKGLEKTFFSTVLGMEMPKQQRLDTQYWVDHAKNAVRFLQTAQLVHKSTIVDVIVDIGPQPTIWSNMQTQEFAGKTRLAFTGKRGKDQVVAMLSGLSGLFEQGFSVDFGLLHDEMPYTFAMTDIPTYPFQRMHNYPAFVANRNSLLGFSSSLRVDASVPQFVIDQALCNFLDSHRIEGRRVLPGAAMVDFFARAADSKSVKNLRFHVPLVLESPETQARAELDEKGFCQLVLQDEASTKICSGTVGDKPSVYLPRRIEADNSPIHVMSKTEVYHCFKEVQFGDLFHTVQQVRFWETHADGVVQVNQTDDPSHDRIRKLDACLHMFAAISSRLAPSTPEGQGAYLPTSLEDFALHTDDMPYDFTCRYYLPLEVGRGARTLTASFEVFSGTGGLLVSCKKYTVAWVPRGVVHREQAMDLVTEKDSWFRNAWIGQPLPRSDASYHKFSEVLHITCGSSTEVIQALSSAAKKTTTLQLCDTAESRDEGRVVWDHELSSTFSAMQCQDMLVVVDLTRADNFPGSNEFQSIYGRILSLLEFIAEGKFDISSFLVLTSWSTPVDLYKEGLVLFSDSEASASSLIGSAVQGMLRVFRQETGLLSAAWCLDLPDLNILDQKSLNDILIDEISARMQGLFSDTFVSYREDVAKKSLVRLVSSLQRVEGVPTGTISGTTVVVGLGSIGIKIATALIEQGVSHVVFLSRESEDDANKELSSLSVNRCSYRQVDVCDPLAVKAAFADIDDKLGNIKHIIQTAESVAIGSYEAVLQPKVLCAWNLHTASNELGLSLESFVLLSSINVVTGNPGHMADVSANAFLDSLATYRHNCGLPGISLQLGDWESDTDDSISKRMNHSRGIPLLVKAMTVPIASQVITQLDFDNISATPFLARDPFFASVLASKDSMSNKKPKLSTEQANQLIVNMLRVAMELQASEKLDTNEPLTSCGADSIAFAQFKGQVLKELQVDVPIMYLSDEYSINDMIVNIMETYGAA